MTDPEGVDERTDDEHADQRAADAALLATVDALWRDEAATAA